MREKNKFIARCSDIDTVTRGRISSPCSVSSNLDLFILSGFTDVHVHLREPGFLYKETMESGTMAAAAGGFTDVFSMPNLNPCPDSYENLRVQLEAIDRGAKVNVYPYGAISKGEKGEELANLKELAPQVIAFTDDGFGVANESIMREAMMEAKSMGKIIVAHCEDENYPKCSSEAEWKQLERDLRLVSETGCKYHVCHISTKESVALVRKAKRGGLDITCETAPHYLSITKEDVIEYIEEHEYGFGGANEQYEGKGDKCIKGNLIKTGNFSVLTSGRFKMNPPLKSRADREALIEALADGTIDMIATDHAPHSAEEKARGFEDSAFGIVGLETAFPILYTELVEKGIITLDTLMELLYENPRRRFGLDVIGIKDMLTSSKPTYSLWNLNEEYIIDSAEFMSMGRSTPFDGWKVKGMCIQTVIDGKIVYERGEKCAK